MRKIGKSGFTLIEIIVVMIIIGILAAVALPNLFKHVQTSQGVSALQTAQALETPIEACLARYSNVNPGGAPCGLNTIANNGTSATVATAANNMDIELWNSGGTYAGDNLAYELLGDLPGSGEVFDLSRLASGIFTCTPTAAGTTYSDVC